MCSYTKVSKEKHYTIKVTRVEKEEALPHTARTHSHTSTLAYSPGMGKKADTKEPSPKLFRVKKKWGVVDLKTNTAKY